METLKKCLNPKVLIGLASLAVGILVFAPKLFVTVLPLLLLAACPLSMVLMMAMMGGHKGSGDQSSLSMLRKRYAAGEIDDEEYKRMKKELAQ